MPDLPDRPNLGQLRHQARELLRAAAAGDPSALSRLRGVTAPTSLSGAQLAVAREHGFANWPALRAEVQRRLAALGADHGSGAAARWSFGGGAAVEIAVGVLHPGVLVAGPDHAALDASLVTAGEAPATMPPPRDRSARVALASSAHGRARALTEAITAAVEFRDDQGTAYALRVESMSFGRAPDEQGRRVVSMRLEVDPVPSRQRGWLALHGQDGAQARLLPSARAEVRVSGPAAVPGSPAARELSDRALWLLGMRLSGASQDAMDRECSAVLARAAQAQQSGELGAEADLPGQLTLLWAVLTGRGEADGLPRGWASLLDAADAIDETRRHYDIGSELPPVGDVVVDVDCLACEPQGWNLYLRAEPGWWIYSADRQTKRTVMSVQAEDDLGGLYVDQFGGSTMRSGREEVVVRFRPRLSPLARGLTLTFRGATEQVTVDVRF